MGLKDNVIIALNIVLQMADKNSTIQLLQGAG
jgi:hypothetical protein